MFANVWKRGRRAALAGVLSAGMLAGGAVVAGASAGAATAAPQVRIPWSQAGPGWELVEYTTGIQAKHAPTTLYLVSPPGAKYPVYTWRASANFAPGLVAWSGDKTRALLMPNGASNQYEQLNLMTGKLTKFTIADQAQAIGYTRPRGLNIIGITFSGSVTTLARYSLTGARTKVLATSTDFEPASGLYSADGTMLAVSGTTGLRLISNAGGLIRTLPVRNTDPKMGCVPERWWNSGTVLAGCFASSKFETMRLWLVPASGATPMPLTPQHSAADGDYGDIGAWQLKSGLYLQSLGACGTLVLNKENKNGTVSKVNVPGTTNDNTVVVTALGQRLLISALTECPGSNSLLWFNPGTNAEQWLFRAPGQAFGVLGVVPYYTRRHEASNYGTPR